MVNPRDGSAADAPRYPPPRATAGPAYTAVLSALFGIVAVMAALSPLSAGLVGHPNGFVLTTIGLAAIVFGVRAIRANRAFGSLLARCASTVGIGTGIIANLAMIAVFLTAVPTAPAMVRPVAIARATAVVAPPTDVLPAQPVTSLDLTQYLREASLRIRLESGRTGPWPRSIEMNDRHQLIDADTHEVLVELPGSVDHRYRSSIAGSTLTLSAAADPTVYAWIDSTDQVVHRSGE